MTEYPVASEPQGIRKRHSQLLGLTLQKVEHNPFKPIWLSTLLVVISRLSDENYTVYQTHCLGKRAVSTKKKV